MKKMAGGVILRNYWKIKNLRGYSLKARMKVVKQVQFLLSMIF